MAVMLSVPAIASRIVEDSRAKFVLDDEVVESSLHTCGPGDRDQVKVFPEDAFWDDGNGVPFRYYRVALPTNSLPSVSVEDKNLVPVTKPYCKSDTLSFASVSASAPIFRDGLWITDIKVPLLVKQGSSIAIRKNFRLRVEFNGSFNGVNPGKRALSKVRNQAGAVRFGVPKSKLQKKSRMSADGLSDDVTFLVELKVGDQNVATFDEDGLYAVEYSTLRNALLPLKRQGELEGVKVEDICLYTASQDTLSDMVPGKDLRYPNQIFEVPIEIRDHSKGNSSPDGIFGEGDTLVFLGYGNGFWKRCDREDSTFVNGKMDYFHSYSPYSYFQHFMLGRKTGGKSLRLDDKLKAVSGTGKDVEWMRYTRAEKDAILRDAYHSRGLDWEGSSGKEWFWIWHARKDSTVLESSEFNPPETTTLPGLISGGRQYVSMSYFPHRSTGTGSAAEEDDQERTPQMSMESYSFRMSQIHFSFVSNGKELLYNQATLLPAGNFRLDNPELKSSGNSYAIKLLSNTAQFDRFDGYTVAYQWNPTVKSVEWLLPGKVSGVIKIPVESNVQVMKFKNLKPMGLLPVSDGFAKDSVSETDDVRYLAYRNNQFRSSASLSVAGISTPSVNVLNRLDRPAKNIEYLIVTTEALQDEAVKLAEFRGSDSSVSVIPTAVVTVENIYRYYTAGRVSPVAIRNYLAYVKESCDNFQYVLLAGAGNYDYRGSNSSLRPNLVPPFEKEDAVTEDFYAALDSGEVVRYGSYDLDVAVGRLTVISADELASYLNKVKAYEMRGRMNYSDWRSNIIFAADDAINSGHVDGEKSAARQEVIARSIDSLGHLKNTRWNIEKLYLVEYEEDAAAQKKEAAADLIDLMDQGALFTIYFGHGSKTDWASEGLMKASYVNRLNNKGRSTILGSFSCTVGRFDDGKARSLSEEFVHAADVGSIASIGANRETYGEENNALARGILMNALAEKNIRLGDAFRKSKGITFSKYSKFRYNAEHYVLHGEPVVQMPRVEHEIRLDQRLDTLKALDKVRLSGSVDGIDDGFVDLTISGSRMSRVVDLQQDLGFIGVDYAGPMIYSEEIPVKNGRFEVEFMTPRKLSFGDTAAEIKAWAYTSKEPVVARYWRDDLVISGVSSYADSVSDTIPPTIQIQSCINSGIASDFSSDERIKLQSPACLQVVISDSSALDYREQADEGISFELRGVKSPFHPKRPFLEQSSRRAKIRMNFTSEQYPAGEYVFVVRAVDVFGNVALKGVTFEITEDMESGLADVFNAPNPMGKKGTTFYFKNLAVGRDSKVNIYIYSQNGKLVQVLKDAVSGVTHWNGRDMHGRLLANGLYHYVVRSEVSASGSLGKKTWTKKQKLLISR